MYETVTGVTESCGVAMSWRHRDVDAEMRFAEAKGKQRGVRRGKW